jgi:hypothetical protein
MPVRKLENHYAKAINTNEQKQGGWHGRQSCGGGRPLTVSRSSQVRFVKQWIALKTEAGHPPAADDAFAAKPTNRLWIVTLHGQPASQEQLGCRDVD